MISSLFCCKTTKLSTVQMSKTQTVLLCDSTRASTLIVEDFTDHFFEKINVLDMSIQMNRKYIDGTTRREILKDYENYLQKDVSSFTTEEQKLLNECLKEISTTCNYLNVNILPNNLNLIKSKATNYGQGTWYTRENCIIIPFDALKAKEKDKIVETLYHEIFHCYSRANTEKRASLYSLIGFKAIEKPLNMPRALQDRVLLNPDGVNYAQKIDLQQAPDKILSAIPIILANEYQVVQNKKSFFQYLRFDLFEVIDEPSHVDVMTKVDAISTTININEQPDFYRQIRDNTKYIIHPDEVLADNFMFLCQSIKNPNRLDDFSPEGKELIKKVKEIVMKD